LARRVFFSFHYQDVIDFRANVVRNHNVTKDNSGGYFDASLWESTKRNGEISIKRLINSGLDNTTVTVVLIGSETYARRWVKYEIFKSIERGNSILGIHINNNKCKYGYTRSLGPNPFQHLGLFISADGKKAYPTEWNGQNWVYSNDVDGFPIKPIANQYWDKNTQLSEWFVVKDWVADNGYENFASWVG
jgi:hypothetical protein